MGMVLLLVSLALTELPWNFYCKVVIASVQLNQCLLNSSNHIHMDCLRMHGNKISIIDQCEKKGLQKELHDFIRVM